MADEGDLTRGLLELLRYASSDLPPDGIRPIAGADDIQSMWAEAGLPTEPANDDVGRSQLAIANDVLRRLIVTGRSLQYIHRRSSTIGAQAVASDREAEGPVYRVTHATPPGEGLAREGDGQAYESIPSLSDEEAALLGQLEDLSNLITLFLDDGSSTDAQEPEG